MLAASPSCLPATRVGETIDQAHAPARRVGGARCNPLLVVVGGALCRNDDDLRERAARLGDLLERAERVDGLRNDVEALKAMIEERRAMAAAPATRAKVRT